MSFPSKREGERRSAIRELIRARLVGNQEGRREPLMAPPKGFLPARLSRRLKALWRKDGAS